MAGKNWVDETKKGIKYFRGNKKMKINGAHYSSGG